MTYSELVNLTLATLFSLLLTSSIDKGFPDSNICFASATHSVAILASLDILFTVSAAFI